MNQHSSTQRRKFQHTNDMSSNASSALTPRKKIEYSITCKEFDPKIKLKVLSYLNVLNLGWGSILKPLAGKIPERTSKKRKWTKKGKGYIFGQG